jgi:crotonobetainyl-CoA:carnitine CoA-transferase CaiB-like acyl-CoA transferase
LLADLGADVIKVERPDVGDDTRSWGPPFLKAAEDGAPLDAGYFLALNRGKRSITADLGSASGQRLVRELARSSDILLENFKVGTLDRFGLSYSDLKRENPHLIYCSITGFGQTGPRREQAAYDFMMQAMGGLMSVTGTADGEPGGGPQKVGVPIIDIMTGMYAAVAVLAALARRDHAGHGEYIDIGMLDVAIASLANQAMNYLITGQSPRRTGNAHPNIQPQDVFATSDGHIALAVGNDGQFAKFCGAIGHPELSLDERFATNAGRVRHSATLTPMLRQILAGQTTASWAESFERAGVPAGPIQSIATALADPQVIERQMIVRLPHAPAGEIRMVATGAPPPSLGQHTEEILSEVRGDSASEVDTSAEHVRETA